MNHYRKTRKLHDTRRRKGGCPFCDPADQHNAVAQDELVYVVPNLTQYDIWELHDVIDNLLIVPKRHVESLHDTTDDEQAAIMKYIIRYEALGYSIYARGVGSKRRSVKHQHTHLIKIAPQEAKIAFFLQKPYFLFKK